MLRTIQSFFAVLLICGGCAAVDVSNDKDYPTDYKTNQTYAIKVPLFLLKSSFLLAPGDNGSVPPSVDEYKKGSSRWPDVAGYIERGTKLKIKSIELEKNPEMGNSVWVRAEILGGSLAGKMSELTFISTKIYQQKPRAKVPKVNPKYLELVAQ